jgi:hypothetical protein
MKKRGQAAMEFLMTYGWAIMVVLVAIGSLSYFGVLSPDKFVPRRCALEPGIACMDFSVNENSVTLVLKTARGEDITINNIKAGNCTGTSSGFMRNGEQATFVIGGCSNTVSKKFIGSLNVTYTGETGLTHKNRGNIVGKVESGTSAGSEPPETCSDGTQYGQCSTTKPEYCEDGTLIDNCQVCGCSGGMVCQEAGNCEEEGSGQGSDGPLDEIASQLTANINESLPEDWNGAKGDKDNLVLKLFSEVAYDIYLESFTLSWNDPTNKFKHFQHLTQENGWSKIKIYGDVDEFSPVNGVFNDKGNREANLKIPANVYTIIDDLHFNNDIELPTSFVLILNFVDIDELSLGSSTLSFTIS